MTRKVLLLEIGAGALPATTPPAPATATWAPMVYTPPPIPTPSGFAAASMADTVLLTWNPVAAPAVEYAIERAPDAGGIAGAWSEIARTGNRTYAASVANGTHYWWRVRALSYQRPSAYTSALKAGSVPLSAAFNGGGNLLTNAEFGELNGWQLSQSGNPSASIGLVPSSNDWMPDGIDGIQVVNGAAGRITTGYAEAITNAPIACEVGKWYIASAYAGAHRCSTEVFIVFLDGAGTWLAAFGSGQQAAYIGGDSLAQFQRQSARGQAPANARRMMVLLRIWPLTGAADLQSYGFFCRPMLEQVSEYQTTPSAWVPPATGLQARARQAQASADAANAELGNIASDNVLTPVEKMSVVEKANVIDAEYPAIRGQALTYNIATELANYDAAKVALTNYLATLTTPVLWSNLAGNTTIAGSTFRAHWATYYSARQALLNKIVSVQVPSADGLVLNPNFDFGSTDWTLETGWYTETSTNAAVLGTGLVHGGAGSTYAHNAKRFPVAGGSRVMVTANIRNLLGTANGNAHVMLFCYAADGTFLGAPSGAWSEAQRRAGTEWRSLAKELTALGGTAYAHISLFATNTAGYFCFDNVRAAYMASSPAAPQNGVNLIPNSNFSSNLGGFPIGTSEKQVGEFVTDDWYIDTRQGYLANGTSATAGLETSDFNSNYRQLFMGDNGGTLPPGASAFYATTKTRIPVVAGQRYAMDYHWQVDAAAAPPAGVIRYSYMGLWGFDRDGNRTWFGGVSNPGTGAWNSSFTVEIPANVAFVQGVVGFDYNNTTGGNVTMPWAVTHARFRQLNVRRILNLDSLAVEDGSENGRYAVIDSYWDGTRRRNGLRVPGSGHRIGDNRNLPQVMVGNGRAKVATSITYTSAAGSPATATISVGAFSVITGSVTVTYSASSVGVSGSGGTSVTYYLYMDDPAYAGGARTLVATSNGNDVYSADGRLYIGSVTVVFPTSGGSSGGGGRIDCIAFGMAIDAHTLVEDARPGHLFDCIDFPSQRTAPFRRRLLAVEHSVAACVRLATEGGAALVCSTSTPFDLPDGRQVWAPEMLGELVLTDRGLERVTELTEAGNHKVAHIHLGGISFAAGEDPAYRIYSHNQQQKP